MSSAQPHHSYPAPTFAPLPLPESAPAVRLPRSRPRTPASEKEHKEPLWPIYNPSSPLPPSSPPTPSLPPSLHATCARDTQSRDGICCKTLKGNDERQLIDPDIIRDIVIGLSDGLTVPFALTAGLSSLGQSRLVVMGGVAELIAGAFSMGIGGFLASQAERDHYRHQRRVTRARVLRSCEGEVAREVYGVLGPVGVDETASRAVATSLLARELGGPSAASTSSGVRPDAEAASTGHGSAAVRSSISRWWNTDTDDGDGGAPHIGVTAFLLQFGEGLEEVPTKRLYISALTIGLGYLLGGIIPLLPYFFISRARVALIYSSILTGCILLLFGLAKAHVTGAARSLGGYVWGAVSTMLVGGAGAAAAYGIVAALEAHSDSAQTST